MRALLASIALVALAAGCLGGDDGTVPAALVHESIALGPGAPEEAYERIRRDGCMPGYYDPGERTITLEPRDRDLTPRFVMVHHRDGQAHVALSAGSSGGWLGARGGSGSWGLGGDFPGAPEGPMLAWDGEGATFDGEALVDDATVVRRYAYDVVWQGHAFSVTQTYVASYVGEVPYEERPMCTDL